MRKCSFLPVGARRSYQTGGAEFTGACKLLDEGNGKQTPDPLRDQYPLAIMKPSLHPCCSPMFAFAFLCKQCILILALTLPLLSLSQFC